MNTITPKAIFYTTVFLTGAAVLIFEVAAVRLFAPYFGASLYVLSSVLTVILGALSLGYYLGGRLADRMPHFLPLYYIIGSAGIIMLFLLLLAETLLPVAAPLFSITTGPLFFSCIFFLMPAFLLGIDSPFVIRILTETTTDHTKHGAIVGSVFFWSTVGSIIGSISAGFFLIPTLGLTLTITVTAGILVLWSIIASSLLYVQLPSSEKYVKSSLLFYSFAAALVITGFLIFQLTATAAVSTPSMRTQYKSDGFYSSIHVFDATVNGTEYRFLKGDTNNSSAIKLYDKTLVFAYTQPITIADDIVPTAKNFLLLGGGAYTIPRWLHAQQPELLIDVVELEPELYELAQTYFELPKTDTITNYAQDARVFIQSTTTTYDIFFTDVFNSGHFIPPHLSTVETNRILKDRLSADGVGFMNVIGALYDTEPNLTDSLLKSIAVVFPNYKVIAMEDPSSSELQNLIVIVRHDDKPINLPDATITATMGTTTTPLRDLEVTNYTPHPNSPLLYDDKNATEKLLVRQIKLHNR